jgi:hypothetical protein
MCDTRYENKNDQNHQGTNDHQNPKPEMKQANDQQRLEQQFAHKTQQSQPAQK